MLNPPTPKPTWLNKDFTPRVLVLPDYKAPKAPVMPKYYYEMSPEGRANFEKLRIRQQNREINMPDKRRAALEEFRKQNLVDQKLNSKFSELELLKWAEAEEYIKNTRSFAKFIESKIAAREKAKIEAKTEKSYLSCSSARDLKDCKLITKDEAFQISRKLDLPIEEVENSKQKN